MSNDAARSALLAAARKELPRILDFWLLHSVDNVSGGFYSSITNDLEVDPGAPKGLVLNARILWTFSRAYRHLPRADYAEAAGRAFAYLRDNFLDAQCGGYYLSVDATGKPLRTIKQTYAQAFVLYGLSEYARAMGGQEALELARDQYWTVERARDPEFGGYLEAFTREWAPEKNTALGDDDPNEKKSMNTHLHIMEAYTNAFRALPLPELRKSLVAVAEIIRDKVLDPATAHFLLYFDEDWTPTSRKVSYGHDIEGSWLCVETAEALGDPVTIAGSHLMALRMADAVMREGVAPDGSVLYEKDGSGRVDDDRHWWPQAEAVVGFLNAFQLSGDNKYLDAASNVWAYIEKYMLDYRHGEWFWKVDRHGLPSPEKKKVDTWKCPYHNSRACFEVIERLEGKGSPGEAETGEAETGRQARDDSGIHDSDR
jgi:mannobiose 2-epimerase